MLVRRRQAGACGQLNTKHLEVIGGHDSATMRSLRLLALSPTGTCHVSREAAECLRAVAEVDVERIGKVKVITAATGPRDNLHEPVRFVDRQ